MPYQVNVEQENRIISGIWKFDAKVFVETIGKFATEILLDQPTAYRSMHIRKCSKTQLGISFVYDCGVTADKATYDNFFNIMTDKLKRRFGNDFVGWDVTSNVWTLTVVKWPPLDYGTKVRTTQANPALSKEWFETALGSRKWGMMGEILTHHDLLQDVSYGVKHSDGSVGTYHPSELEVLQ